MAREFLEEFIYNQMERAFAASSSAPSLVQPEEKSTTNLNNVVDVIDILKRKFHRVQSNLEHHYRSVVYNNFGLPNPGPIKRKPFDNGENTRLVSGETIEMAHLERGDFREKREIGKGHEFAPQQLINPTWCDQCGDFIWGVLKQCLRCQHCPYTCHHRCRPLVTLDCSRLSRENGEAGKGEGEGLVETSGMYNNCQSCQAENHLSQSPDHSVNDDTDSGYRSGGITGRHRSNSRSRLKHDPDAEKREEIRMLIDRYNEESPSSLFCFIGNSLSFQGFIRVTLNMIRPITMSLGARPPSIYEVLTKEHIVEQNTMSISFYMPRDTIKQIHVASDNTTKEVVTALLKKFKILDHPRKFALYAQELNNGKLVKLWRVVDKDFPLKVCLNWGSEDLKKHRLVLQENETGEIDWDAFSHPELNNFMRILDKEEDECTQQLQYKYKVMKRIIQQRMKEIRKERKEQSQRS